MRELTPVPAEWLGRPLAETRWVLEAARLFADPVAYGRGVPRGDGRPVIVVPGFLASDDSLLLLRRWLRIVGYRPHTAGFLFNVDCAERAVERVERLAEAINATTGRRVAIIGHSRGGHLARATAARRPDLVSHAISMGADLQGLFGISSPTRAAVGDRAPRAARHPPQPRPGLHPRTLQLRVHPRLHGRVPGRSRAPDVDLHARATASCAGSARSSRRPTASRSPAATSG